MPHPPMPALRGFTLIELLVVITIVSILAGLALPAISMVKTAAKGTNCQNNLRQLGLAFGGYMHDNEDSLPRGWNDGTSAVDVSWDDLLGSAYDGRDLPMSGGTLNMNQRYLHIAGTAAKSALYNMYRCPADDAGMRGPIIAGAADSTYWKRTYAVTGYGSTMPSADTAISKGLMSNCDNVAGTDWAVRSAEINKPSQKILLAEILAETSALGRGGVGTTCVSPRDQNNDAYYGNASPLPLHRGKWNYLFVDGHVATLLGSETQLVNSYQFPGYMWDRTY